MTTRKLATEVGFEAYLDLLDVLEEEHTVAQLDEELDCAKPTIYRYVNFLDEIGLVEEVGKQFPGATIEDPRGRTESLWQRTTDEIHFDLDGSIDGGPPMYAQRGNRA